MRAFIVLVLIVVSVPDCGGVWGADTIYRVGDKTVVTPDQRQPAPDARRPQPKAGPNGGAMPEASQAEKQRELESQFQAHLLTVGSSVENLEGRMREMRRQVDQPARIDMERIERDLALTEDELTKITSSGVSPLTLLQRDDLQDRLFELRVSLEILKTRWGSSPRVFGMDFFTSVAVPTGPEQGPVPASYKIRVGDTLRIQVSSSLGAHNEYNPVVDTSGRISVSGVGSVYCAGKTVGALQQTLSNKLRSRFPQLRVDVALDKLSTIRVQVSGEVAKPGTYAMTGMATVFGALCQAGGPTKSGTFRRLSLVREGRPPRQIDLYRFLLNGSKQDDTPLEDGDLVFVPPVGGTIVVEGEVTRPGRYEPDFPLTLADALKMAGGAKTGGYLQTLQVERVENGEYKLLLSAPLGGVDGKDGFVIKPGDQVTVLAVRPDRTNQVVVQGPVGAPGMYGLREGMRVSDLIKLAQGLDAKTEVYTGRADILRVDPLKGSEILTFDLARALAGDPEADIVLKKLDTLFVYRPEQVEFRPRVVTIVGEVLKPGVYMRTDGMRVSDLVAAAGGVLPDAYLDRADMVRHSEPDTTELARVQLRSALSGDANANLKLQDRDELTVYSLSQAGWRDRTVRIEGAVQRPGVYARSGSMRVSDLLFACGGLLPEASDVAEVANGSAVGKSKIVRVHLDRLVPSSEEDLVLQDRDTVTVPSVNPSLRSAEVVYLTGEVLRPGPYALNGRDDKLTDLIDRAGGLTPYADVGGMLFLRQREKFENSQQDKDVDIILERSRAFSDKQFLTHLAKLGVGLPGQFIQAIQQSAEQLAKPAQVVAEEKLVSTTEDGLETDTAAKSSPDLAALIKKSKPSVNDVESTTDPEALAEAERASAMGPRVAEPGRPAVISSDGDRDLKLLATSARVSVNLSRAFSDRHSPDNITLRDGDRVFVPRITNVVTVIGAVLVPHSFAAGPGKSVSHYIEMSGGFAQDAAKGSVVVVRSNGDALPMSRVKTVQPGDTIVVPTTGLIDIAKKWERVGSVTKVISDILSSVFILTRF